MTYRRFRQIVKKNMKRRLIAILIGCMVTTNSVCAAPIYDVLDKVADTKTVGESIDDKVTKEIEKESENVEHFIRSIASDPSDESDEKEEEPHDHEADRPKYVLSDYVDTSKCDLKKIEKDDSESSDEEVEQAILDAMVQEGIYADAEESKVGDLVVINYKAKEGKGQILDVKEEERIIGNNLFPEEIDEKLIGKKAGDEVDVTYTYPKDYNDKKYAGRTIEYHIEIVSVQSAEISADTVYELTGGEFASVDEYKEYVKDVLDNKTEDYLWQLCDMVEVKELPKDVLEYDKEDIKYHVMSENGLEGLKGDKLEEKVKEMGFNSSEELFEEIDSTAAATLEEELRVMAVYEKFGNGDEIEDYYEAWDKLYENLEAEMDTADGSDVDHEAQK